jgi:hypothetical protein
VEKKKAQGFPPPVFGLELTVKEVVSEFGVRGITY